MAEDKKPQRQSIADDFTGQVINMIKEGVAPWQKPWKAGEFHMPFNSVSETNYKGVNVVMLGRHGYADPRWMTFKQATAKGYSVKKGSLAQKVVFWQWKEERTLRDGNGQPVRDAEGNPVKEMIDLDRPRLYVYNVFHHSQILNEQGQPLPPFEGIAPTWNPHDRAEAILAAAGVKIVHDQRDRAFYKPSEDTIHLPPKENFPDAGNYYSCALHELGHALGHESRLNWESTKAAGFGTPEYAKEELRVEIASWMLCQELGLPHDPSRHAAYAEHWVKGLGDDKYEIMRASQMAEKIKGKILDVERGLPFGQEVEKGAPTLAELTGQPQENEAGALNVADAVVEKLAAQGITPSDRAVEALGRMRVLEPEFRIEALRRGKLTEARAWYPVSDDQRADLFAVMDKKGYIVATSETRHEAEARIEAIQKEADLHLKVADTKVYLNVPYKEKGLAKALGATWDNGKQSWCARPGTYLAPLAKWIPENAKEAAASETWTAVALMERDGKPWPTIIYSNYESQAEAEAGATRFAHAYNSTGFEPKEIFIARNSRKIKALYALIDSNNRFPAQHEAAWAAYVAQVQAEGFVFKSGLANQHDQVQAEKPEQQPEPAPEKTFLSVPYSEKDLAWKLGAKWDRQAGLWYAPAGADLAPLAKYLPERTPAPTKEIRPEAELAEALKQAGLKIDGLPVMDGKIHRLEAVGGKSGSRDGAYCAHQDGRPAGWIMNYRTGEKTTWVSTGQTLTPEQKADLAAKDAERRAEREAQRRQEQDAAKAKAAERWNAGSLFVGGFDVHQEKGSAFHLTQPYLRNKLEHGLEVSTPGLDNYVQRDQLNRIINGLKVDEKGTLMIPGYDKDGKLQTIQNINPQGLKWFERGCPKTGAMHVLGVDPEKGPAGLGHLRDIKSTYVVRISGGVSPGKPMSPTILISEGLATGASIYLATNNPVVVALDANNLKAVATAVREVHPEARIVLCADNDHKTEINIGLTKAREAAQAVGGEVISPEFTQEEKAQGLTDFNDLHQSRGISAVQEAFSYFGIDEEKTVGQVTKMGNEFIKVPRQQESSKQAAASLSL